MGKKSVVRVHGGRRWEGEQGSNHALWKIPVCIMQTTAKGGRESDRMYLAVRTTTVPHVLLPDPQEVNFQEVTVKQRMIKRISIRNFNPKTPQTLRMDPLPENACFTVL